jgi:hypothetical protein
MKKLNIKDKGLRASQQYGNANLPPFYRISQQSKNLPPNMQSIDMDKGSNDGTHENFNSINHQAANYSGSSSKLN